METENNTAPATETAGATPQKKASKNHVRRMVRAVLILIILVALAGGSYYFLTKEGGLLEQPVATVNGEKISMSEYNTIVTNITKSAELQSNQLITDENIKEQIKSDALNRIINTKLLVQASIAAGYSASDEQIDEQLAAITEQFGGEEAFQLHLTSNELSKDAVRKDVREQIIVDQYLSNETEINNITVTPEEVAGFYQTLLSQYGEEVPTLEELGTQIESDLLAQKQQLALSEILAELRAKATIKTN